MQKIVHIELHTSNLGGAAHFVHGMFGWKPEHVRTPHGSYLALDMGGEVGGGIVEGELDRALWVPYVEVPEIGAATDRARSLGAEVVLEPAEGSAGFRSRIRTGCGTELAFWQQKR